MSIPVNAAGKVNLRTPEVMKLVQAQVESHYRSPVVDYLRHTKSYLSANGLTVKLAKAFGVTGEDNGIDLLDPGSTVRIVPGHQEVKIVETTRIGIAEGKGHELQWRYLDGDRLEWCSRRPR